MWIAAQAPPYFFRPHRIFALAATLDGEACPASPPTACANIRSVRLSLMRHSPGLKRTSCVCGIAQY